MESAYGHIKEALKKALPGSISHRKFLPQTRTLIVDRHDTGSLKHSSVMLLLFEEKEELYVCLIKRTGHMKFHPGQIAFPGGKYEDSDEDLRTTALREVEEEIGIKADAVEILGYLTDLYIPPSNFMVRAYVGYLKEEPVFNIDDREVQEVLVLGYEHFKHPDVINIREFKTHNSTRLTKAPYFEVDGAIIWGATAMILTELLDLEC